MKTKIDWDRELEVVCENLKLAVETGDMVHFYNSLKKGNIPFVPCHIRDPLLVHKTCSKILHRISEISMPVSIALSMHYYVLASMSTYAFPKGSMKYFKRELLLETILSRKILIANTGSVRTFKDSENTNTAVAKKVGDTYYINGETPFASLSGVADFLVFTIKLEGKGNATFFAPAQDENIIYQDAIFGDEMSDSFTHALKFVNLEVNDQFVIVHDEKEVSNNDMLVFQRIWFQTFVPNAYLGGVLTALNALKDFSKKKMRNNKRLFDSESFIENIGELLIKYNTAKRLNELVGFKFDQYEAGNQQVLKELFETSVLSKRYATDIAEEIVRMIRKMMGTAFMRPDSITSEISKQVVYGVLQPMTDLDIKLFFGNSFLKNK